MNKTVPEPNLVEATVLVRFDPTQTDACVIAGRPEEPSAIVAYGPTPPSSDDRGEYMLLSILRALVAPLGVDELHGGDCR